MSRLVMKFGGTSVADLDKIANAASKVAQEVKNGLVLMSHIIKAMPDLSSVQLLKLIQQ